MKDMNDVVSYLTNVLGEHHDLTIAARESSVKKEESEGINIDPDAQEVMLLALSMMIYEIKPVGHIVWTNEKLPQQLKEAVLICLDEILEELDLSDQYPEDSDELMGLGLHIEMTCNDRPEEVLKLVKKIEADCAADVLKCISTWRM